MSMFNRLFTLCVIAMSLYAQGNQAATPDSALRISPAVPDGLGNFVAPVLNIGTKTITAYSITRESWPSASWCQCTLQPNDTSGVGTQPSWGSSMEDGTPIKVVAIIFEDDTAVGQDKEIDKLFAFRRGEAAELQALLDASQPIANSPTFKADFAKILKSRENSVITTPEQNGASTAIAVVRTHLENSTTPQKFVQAVTERSRLVQLHMRRAQ
jgi:hypothetical protein